MINDINKMLKVVADATTELENKITEYLGKDICVDIENIDYESFKLIMCNPELKKRCWIDYHVLYSNDITVYYCIEYRMYNNKDFNNLSDALEDIKEFLNKECC